MYVWVRPACLMNVPLLLQRTHWRDGHSKECKSLAATTVTDMVPATTVTDTVPATPTTGTVPDAPTTGTVSAAHSPHTVPTTHSPHTAPAASSSSGMLGGGAAIRLRETKWGLGGRQGQHRQEQGLGQGPGLFPPSRVFACQPT